MKEEKEYIKFQYIMNYKAYRRFMYMTRLSLTALAVGGLACFAIIRVWLGIIFAGIALSAGAVAVIAALHREETYIIFNTRFVTKHGEKRASVPLENITSVKYKRAFYEKKLATGTVTIKAKDPQKGKIKKYRLRHIFDAKEGVMFLQNAAAENAKSSTVKGSNNESNG